VSHLEVRPAELTEANTWIEEVHSHHPKVTGHKFSLRCERDGEVMGFVVVGRTSPRSLHNGGLTLEVTRLCTDGEKNAGSKLLGAVARATGAMGYELLISYLQDGEAGTCFKAAGWIQVSLPRKRRQAEWSRRGRQLRLDGTTKQPPDTPRARWEKRLTP